MTDAGEKLRDRIVNSSSYKPNDLNDLCEIVRAELERAAEIADIKPVIAAAIRKLKE